MAVKLAIQTWNKPRPVWGRRNKLIDSEPLDSQVHGEMLAGGRSLKWRSQNMAGKSEVVGMVRINGGLARPRLLRPTRGATGLSIKSATCSMVK